MAMAFTKPSSENQAIIEGLVDTTARHPDYKKEVPIPSEYHVAEVIVGFNAGGKLIWEQNFRVDYD